MDNRISVEMIAEFKKNDKPRPLRFRFAQAEEEAVTVNVDRIVSAEIAGKRDDPTFIYRCESMVGGVLVNYELDFQLRQQEWRLRMN